MPLRENLDFTELMKKRQTRVMIFGKQTSLYTLSADTDYKWIAKPIAVVDQENDYQQPPTDWAKDVQISPTQWMYFGGAIHNTEDQMEPQVGTKHVAKLDTTT